MEKLLLILIYMAFATITVTLPIKMSAESKSNPFTIDGIKYVIINNEYAEVSGFDDYHSDDLILPSVIKYNDSDYIVRRINEWAFINTSFTSVTVPNTITEIENNPFYNCRNLNSIFVEAGNPNYLDIDGVLYDIEQTTLIAYPRTRNNYSIPNSVHTLGDYAFADCVNITCIDLPSSVNTIGNNAFSSCYNLNSITIPTSVISIGSLAFNFCESLESVVLPYTVSEIGDNPFCNCKKLTNISIWGDVVHKYWAMDGILYTVDCTTLISCPGAKTECDIPNTVQTIGNYAFLGCSNLSMLTIPESVNTIGKHAFGGCNKLSSIDLPNSVTTIGDCAFFYCHGLEMVSIPNSVTTIGDQAFWCCNGIKTLDIGNSVTSIGMLAFIHCSSLKTIHIYAKTCPKSGEKAFYGAPEDVVVYVPSESLDSYESEWGVWFSDFRVHGYLDITLSTMNMSMPIGTSQQIEAVIIKENNVPVDSESWYSSDPHVATVENGNVTAVSTGKATITYTAVDGLYKNSYSASCTVVVTALDDIGRIQGDNKPQSVIYYNINGTKITSRPSVSGFYIMHCGSKSEKIFIK